MTTRKQHEETAPRVDRRRFLALSSRCAAGMAVAGLAGVAVTRTDNRRMVWQIDPERCVQCGKCATDCVLQPSAVKCAHAYSVCGYCTLCFGYFEPEAPALDEGGENQLCPTGALKRRFIEEPYYEYTVDPDLCIGCGKCARNCTVFGNGSLYLQIHHDRCMNCNECAIAAVCPTNAIRRIPAAQAYLPKGTDRIT
jgi:electron transport complex protein RnfB